MAARKSGQLDEISQAIGRVDAYVHEFRHGTKNLEQLINATEVAAEKRHATLKVELKAELRESVDAIRKDLANIEGRVVKLEEVRHRQEGQMSVWQWIVEKWPFAALFAGLAAVIAWANEKI